MRTRTDPGADPPRLSDEIVSASFQPDFGSGFGVDASDRASDLGNDARLDPGNDTAGGPAAQPEVDQPEINRAEVDQPEVDQAEEPAQAAEAAEADSEDIRAGQQLIAGDHQAIDYCFRRWGKVIYSSALHALGDPGEADDVTQQVFIAAWRSRRDFDPARGSLPGWLYGIARHRILDRLRGRRREQALLERYASVTDPHPAAEQVVDRLVDHLVLVSELAALPDPRGTILRLSLWEGRSHTEIAAELGLPLGTVKSHARRGLLRLRDRMQAVRR